MKMKASAFLLFAALACMLASAASAAITPYSQDFEGLVMSDPAALANDGWFFYVNVFGGPPDWFFWYGYGGTAPNGGNAHSALVDGQGGPDQGVQQLSIYNDYNNGDHANGGYIEDNVYREMTIEADNVGETWAFHFEAKMGNLELNTTALAFIKTLDPNNGWAQTNYITEDMTSTPLTWTDYTLYLTIDADLVGQIFQYGFQSLATNWEGSGVFYDNINVFLDDLIPTEETSWSGVKSLY